MRDHIDLSRISDEGFDVFDEEDEVDYVGDVVKGKGKAKQGADGGSLLVGRGEETGDGEGGEGGGRGEGGDDEYELHHCCEEYE